MPCLIGFLDLLELRITASFSTLLSGVPLLYCSLPLPPLRPLRHLTVPFAQPAAEAAIKAAMAARPSPWTIFTSLFWESGHGGAPLSSISLHPSLNVQHTSLGKRPWRRAPFPSIFLQDHLVVCWTPFRSFEGALQCAPPSLDSPGTILYLVVNLSASDRPTVVKESGNYLAVSASQLFPLAIHMTSALYRLNRYQYYSLSIGGPTCST